MTEVDVETLKNQLAIARSEINKLRQQVKNLTFIQRKDFDGLKQILKDFRCEGCKQSEENAKNQNAVDKDNTDNGVINFRPIGIIKTSFPEKRAVPRQSSVGNRLKGAIELNSDIFTNPDHSLEGLDDFSHLWIIYHFHKNLSHPKAKVAPPRLGGERIGVFSTRSPHRPCPIGLSLVEIDKIDKSIIYFYGTDMVDGTPVLDIKPYIPFYDTPTAMESGPLSAGCCGDNFDFYNSRQEPDGEESGELGATAMVTSSSSSSSVRVSSSLPYHQQHTTNNHHNHHQHNNHQNIPPPSTVKVPNWIVSNNLLKVTFNERAEQQLNQLNINKECIVDILETDPRSVYLRTKYGCQIFTFQLGEVIVTCKFDDKNSTVQVVQVRRTENLQDENHDTEN